MPQFSPGDSKTAIAPITVKPTGLSAQAELFLGPNDTTKVATSGLKAFISTGVQQNINLPVTMPSLPGTYHVYLDVYAGGVPVAGFIADEDVVIASPAAFSIGVRKKLTDGTILDMYWNCEVWFDITNNGGGSGTHNVHIWDSVGNVDINLSVTLAPGKTYTWYRAQWVDFRRLSSYTVQAQGNWPENNYAKVVFP